MKSAGSEEKPFNFPVFEEPQLEWRPKVVDLGALLDEMEPLCRHYLDHFDSPEECPRTKNPKPFIMH